MSSSNPILQHHHDAAKHHEKAAEHHKEVTKHMEAGHHEAAGNQAYIAYGHSLQATQHSKEAAKLNTNTQSSSKK